MQLLRINCCGVMTAHSLALNWLWVSAPVKKEWKEVWVARAAPGFECDWVLGTRGSVLGATPSRRSQFPPHPPPAPPLPLPLALGPVRPPSGRAAAPSALWRSPGQVYGAAFVQCVRKGSRLHFKKASQLKYWRHYGWEFNFRRDFYINSFLFTF